MYSDKFYLTAKEILEKDFKVDAKGYRPQEVDNFLDMVIRDYDEFTRVIKKLQHDNHILAEDNAKLKAEYRRLKDIVDSAEGANTGISYGNLDLLKRINNLEKIVYGKEE